MPRVRRSAVSKALAPRARRHDFAEGRNSTDPAAAGCDPLDRLAPQPQRNAIVFTPEISNRFRHRRFLHAA
jgi:hypothetical protein